MNQAEVTFDPPLIDDLERAEQLNISLDNLLSDLNWNLSEIQMTQIQLGEIQETIDRTEEGIIEATERIKDAIAMINELRQDILTAQEVIDELSDISPLDPYDEDFGSVVNVMPIEQTWIG